MTTINTDNFNRTLLRLDSNHQEGPGTQKSESLGSFNSVLANVENDNFLALNAPSKIDDQPKLVDDINKTERPNKFVSPPIIQNSEILGDFPLDENDSIGLSALDVSNEVNSSTPDIPQIVSSRIVPPQELAGTNPISPKHEKIKEIIITAGKFHGVDPSLGLAIAKVESSFNPNAVSSDGFASKGVFQLLDSTGKEIHAYSGMTEPYQPFDPSMNSFLGMGHFRRLLDIFSKETPLTSSLTTYPAGSAEDLEKIAVAAYNAGEGNVARAQEKAVRNGKDPTKFSEIRSYLPEITKGYVDKVSNFRNQIATNHEASKIV